MGKIFLFVCFVCFLILILILSNITKKKQVMMGVSSSNLLSVLPELDTFN